MAVVMINKEQGLYVIRSGGGYSCIGFDVVERKRIAVLQWLGKNPYPLPVGTLEHYAAYESVMAWGRDWNRQTGQRCNADLQPRLIGLEGKRVEVTHKSGYSERFWVGKSTGWLPCHLAISRRSSHGGCAAYVPEDSTIRIVAHKR